MKVRIIRIIVAIVALIFVCLIFLQKKVASGNVLFLLKEERAGSGRFTYLIKEFRGSNSVLRHIINAEDSFFYSCEIYYNNRIPLASQTYFMTQSYRLRDVAILIEGGDVVFSLDRRTELRAKNIAINENIVEWEYHYRPVGSR